MFDHAHLIDLIERTIDDDPFCPICRAPTTIRDHDGRLWLECSATPAETSAGRLARLGSRLLPHPHRLIVDLTEDLAA